MQPPTTVSEGEAVSLLALSFSLSLAAAWECGHVHCEISHKAAPALRTLPRLLLHCLCQRVEQKVEKLLRVLLHAVQELICGGEGGVAWQDVPRKNLSASAALLAPHR